MMDPLSAGIMTAGSMISGGLSGQDAGKAYYASPTQFYMQEALRKRAMNGNYGDMGGGQIYKQGMSNLAQFMADRGIRQDSGVYNSAVGNLALNAAQQDVGNLRNYMTTLANMSPAMVNTSSMTGIEGGTWHNPWK